MPLSPESVSIDTPLGPVTLHLYRQGAIGLRADKITVRRVEYSLYAQADWNIAKCKWEWSPRGNDCLTRRDCDWKKSVHAAENAAIASLLPIVIQWAEANEDRLLEGERRYLANEATRAREKIAKIQGEMNLANVELGELEKKIAIFGQPTVTIDKSQVLSQADYEAYRPFLTPEDQVKWDALFGV